MAKERFEHRTLSGNINIACKYDDGTVRYWNTKKEDVIAHILQIVREYSREGYVLTLRQLHYQLVSNNWIINHDTAYKKLGNILDDCRYAGLIDWDAIEDRGRKPYIPYSADDLADGLTDLKKQYRIERQEGQENYVELWTEKDALSGILKRSTEKYHIQLVVNKGYTSSSAIYEAYERIVDKIGDGKKVTILYFGDHDPSGLDMVRDIRERLTLFLSNGTKLRRQTNLLEVIQTFWDRQGMTIYDLQEMEYIDRKSVVDLMEGASSDEANEEYERARIKWFLNETEIFKVLPIGLTMEQIKKYNLPHNPAKMTDSRAKEYVKQYGKISWEVDALKPQTLTSIVETNIKQLIDVDLYNQTMQKEEKDVSRLEAIIGKVEKNKL